MVTRVYTRQQNKLASYCGTKWKMWIKGKCLQRQQGRKANINCSGTRAFARPLTLNNLEILILLYLCFTDKEMEAQRG